MKKIFIISFFFLAFILNAQKKKNGNLYIEHPHIDVVEKFNTAFTSGDTETLKSLVSDDFKWYTTNARTPRTIDQLIGRSS